MLTKCLFILCISSTFCLAHPADVWEMGVETGYLKQVGHSTPLDYEIIPTQIVFRSPFMFDLWDGESGERLLVRNRLALIGELFAEGPEDYYFGVSAAPSLEYWFTGQKTALFCSAGGGIGLTNSGGVAGGLGQDFTLNWFAQLGLRYQLRTDLAVLGGGYFVHHSNGGMTDPNPGIDALGLTLGLSWSF